MKQKLVVKVDNMRDAKSRSKAMKIAVGAPGVMSVSIEGAGKNHIVVVGDGFDSVNLTMLLRRRMGTTDLVSLTPMDERSQKEK